MTIAAAATINVDHLTLDTPLNTSTMTFGLSVPGSLRVAEGGTLTDPDGFSTAGYGSLILDGGTIDGGGVVTNADWDFRGGTMNADMYGNYDIVIGKDGGNSGRVTINGTDHGANKKIVIRSGALDGLPGTHEVDFDALDPDHPAVVEIDGDTDFQFRYGTAFQPGTVKWIGAGGFAAYGGDHSVTMKINTGPTDVISWADAERGFADQDLHLGSHSADGVVTLTNWILCGGDAAAGTDLRTIHAFGPGGRLTGRLGQVKRLAKRGDGMLELALAGSVGTSGEISVYDGQLKLNANAVIGTVVPADLHVDGAGARLTVGAGTTTTANAAWIYDGTLEVDGQLTLAGNVDMQGDGATLTVGGGATLEAQLVNLAGQAEIGIGATITSTAVNISGEPTLLILPWDDLVPDEGDEFVVMTWQTGLDGEFGEVTADPWFTDRRITFDTIYTNTGGPGNLTLRAVPEPATLAMLAAVALPLIVFMRRRRVGRPN